MHHVGNTSHHHVSDCATLVVLHYVLERPSSQDSQKVSMKLNMKKSPEEILLKVEIGQLSLLDELLGQLSEEN